MSMSESNNDTSQKQSVRAAGAKARQTAGKATAPASQAAKSAASATGDAAQTAAKGVEAGRQAIVTASGQVAATARTAWTVIAARKYLAAGVGAGLTALSAASYAAGRRSGRQAQGPLTRLTGGRI